MVPNIDTFCIAPFQHACIENKGDLKICCRSNEKTKYKYNELEKWYNSDTLRSLRNNLINGIKDPICKSCWQDESVNSRSLRQVYNKHIGKILEDQWDKNFEKNKKLIDIISALNFKNINSFELRLGNLCNLKCIMCRSSNSSQLLAEAKINPEVQEFFGKRDQKDYQWPQQKEFKDWCKLFLGCAIHIKFTGGEPFMNPYLLESLESIPDEQKKICILHFNTNLTIINKDILKILSKFKETWISVSVEGIDKVLEYARFGHKWKDLEKNFMLLIKDSPKNVFISVIHVVQSPTFAGILDLVKYFDDLKIKITPSILIDPKCFQFYSIKKHIKEDFLNQIKNYDGYNISYVDSLRLFTQQNIEYDPTLAKQCVYRLKTLDRIRKNNFEEIIPIDYFI